MHRRAFTLVELLVVVAVIATLAALLLPALEASRDEGRKAACVSNLRQIGVGMSLYVAEHEGALPFGPKAGRFTSPSNLYPSTGAPTSLLSLRTGEPVGLGLILSYLQNPKVMFCPGSEPAQDSAKELAKIGKAQAQSSYYYRHAGNTKLFDGANSTASAPILANLGENRNGVPMRALVIDTLFKCPPDLDTFNVTSRYNHKLKAANVLFADGRVGSLDNANGELTVDVSDAGQLHNSFDKILQVFELADER